MDHVGIDVHQKYSQVCEISGGEVAVRAQVPTTQASLLRHFGGRERLRIVLECGGSSRWVARLLRELGHQVVVVNPRRVRLIAESTLKTDAIDAEILARLAGSDPALLQPVYQRRPEAEALRTRLGVRRSLRCTRVAMINSVRGTLRAYGYRMGASSADRFVVRFYELKLPVEIEETLEPLLEMIARLTERIAAVEGALKEWTHQDDLLRRLQTVPGVGPVVASAFQAWLDDPYRFLHSRDVGAYLGARPRIRESADTTRRGRITREGDSEMRRLLVQSAHIVMNTKQDSALKRWALQLAERSGKGKAAVGLARKLAVTLHILWVREETYRPFPKAA
jgi:transposase